MYTEYFGLKEKPFAITPNPAFLFLSKNHKDAFAHLLYGIQQRVGFIELTGEVGTGKTTVLRTLLNQLDTEDYRLAFIFNPSLSALELLQSINREFGLSAESTSAADLHAELNRFLLEENRAGRTVVLVIDEAQNLRPEVLEQIRLLSNLETETDKLIQILLVGQPELAAMLEAPNLRQLSQRITVRYRLGPMDASDTGTYIRHRLDIAGYKGGELFSPRAVKRIYRYSGGFPRLINVICDRSLLIGYSEKQRSVAGAMVSRAEREMKRTIPRQVNSTAWHYPAGAILLILLLVLAGWNLFGHSNESTPAEPRDVAIVNVPAASASVPDRVQVREGATVSDKRLDRVRAWLEQKTEAESFQTALRQVTDAWEVDPATPLPENGRDAGFLERWAAEQGLQLTVFKGRLEGFLRYEVPGIAECLIPGTSDQGFLAMEKSSGGEILVQAGSDKPERMQLTTMQGFWSGRGYLLWKNHEKLPYISQRGVEGDSVSRLQQLLQKAGFKGLEVTGQFDDRTIRAVTDFQRAVGISQDGQVGPQTMMFLYRAAGYPAARLVMGGRA
ncbi:MAG: AAA family ATPase [Desulfuromonas sp.]|nr:MAG: AAA family ATPase [Desulfuromonas sp.]